MMIMKNVRKLIITAIAQEKIEMVHIISVNLRHNIPKNSFLWCFMMVLIMTTI